MKSFLWLLALMIVALVLLGIAEWLKSRTQGKTDALSWLGRIVGWIFKIIGNIMRFILDLVG